MAAKLLIEARQAAKTFGEVRAVDGVDLDIREGETFGLIGRNGAGKSTLFRMMLGLLPLTSGDIRVDGKPVRGAAFREVRRRIGYLPESVVFYDNLTGLETLHFFANLKGVPRTDCPALLERVGLADVARRRVRGFSKGMRQRLGLAQALLGAPVILFLDEPTNGLDPEGVREFYEVLREMNGNRVTVVLTSHILSEIQARVDRLAIMRTGKIQAVGTVQSLREEMDLPLHFDIRVQFGGIDGLRAALTRLGAQNMRVDGDRVSVSCHRDAKMAILRALASPEYQIADLQVREPSLEDVFLGYSG